MKNKKSKAKMMGVKSSLAIGNNTTVMTSFGKGQEANIEHSFENKVDPEEKGKTYNILKKEDDKEITVNEEAKTSYPYQKNSDKLIVRQDVLRLKPLLEKKYYGQEFNDNIHIQIIHCIQDIYKILSVPVNNVLYSLNSIGQHQNNKNKKYEDYIGTLTKDNVNYENFNENGNKFENFIKNIVSYNSFSKKNKIETKKVIGKFSYFNGVFNKNKIINKSIIKKENKKDFVNPKDNQLNIYNLEYIYDVLRILMIIRLNVIDDSTSIDENHKLFSKDLFINDNDKSIKAIINNYVDDTIESINNKFIENNYTFNILPLYKTIFGNENVDNEFINEFYNFSITKSSKNIGFSIKKVREKFLIKYFGEFEININTDEGKKEKRKLDNFEKRKLNNFIDFNIYYYFNNKKNIKELEDIIDNLRKKQKDEIDNYYNDISDNIYDKIKEIVYNSFNNYRSIKKNKNNVKENIKWVAPTLEFTNFSKTMYFFSYFLDKKETNNLFTGLISKIENINSFNKLIKSINDDSLVKKDLVKVYNLFNDSNNLVVELRFLNSIANIKYRNEELNSKKDKYSLRQFSYSVLGMGDVINKYYKNKKNNDNEKYDKVLNYIDNSIIKSNKLIYLSRFCHNANVASVMKNRVIVEYVLKDLSRNNGNEDFSLINRYYTAIKGTEGEIENKIKELTKIITGVSFDTIFNNNDEKYKSIISLYFLIVYSLIKNLIYINSRYVIAFKSYDRDYNIVLSNKNDNTESSELHNKDYIALTKRYIIDKNEKEAIYNKKYINIIKRNIGTIKYKVDNDSKKDVKINLKENNINNLCHYFRNNVAHLTILQNIDKLDKDNYTEKETSYFKMYHYLVQNVIYDEEIYDSIKKYHNKDKCDNNLVKIYCLPFAYNASRYISLTNERLFDKYRMNEKEANNTDSKKNDKNGENDEKFD